MYLLHTSCFIVMTPQASVVSTISPPMEMKGVCCKFLSFPQHGLICQLPRACLNLIHLWLLKLLSRPLSIRTDSERVKGFASWSRRAKTEAVGHDLVRHVRVSVYQKEHVESFCFVKIADVKREFLVMHLQKLGLHAPN